MSTSLRFLGVAGYEIVGPLGRILIDPFLSGNPVAPMGHEDVERPDVILITHAAPDHFGDAAEIALRTGSPIVCGSDSSALLRDRGVPDAQIRATIWGIEIEVGRIRVIPVESHHWSLATLADGSVVPGWPLGFVVSSDPEVSVYHSGDSAIFGDMRLIGDLHQPTAGLLGCTQPWPLVPSHNAGAGRVVTGEMTPEHAAIAAGLLGVHYAIASHYVDPEDEDVTDFIRMVRERDPSGGRIALAPRAGQVIELEPTGPLLPGR